MDKEKDFLEYLKNKSKSLNLKMDELRKEQKEVDSKLVENYLCPYCFHQLKDDEPYFEYAIKSCSYCGFEDQQEINPNQ